MLALFLKSAVVVIVSRGKATLCRAIASKFLSSKDLAKVIFTPARFEPPGFDATLGRRLLFEEVEGHMSQDDKVLLTVILAHATGIFLKGDIEYPVEAILDSPMAAHGRAKGL
jgi:hypothetical protein